jgi:hypothetical protein
VLLCLQEETEDAVAALLEERFDFARYLDDGDDEEGVSHELHNAHEEPVMTAVPDEETLASEEVSTNFVIKVLMTGFIVKIFIRRNKSLGEFNRNFVIQ